MALYNIYREQWTKANGWNVRAEFVPAGGEAKLYSARSVTNVTNVFKDVSGHKGGFEFLPFGVSDAEVCKFTINYTNAPSEMQTALTEQFRNISSGYFGTNTTGYYRDVTYFPGQDAGFPPNQPNLFMVWSDRGTGLGIPTAATIIDGGTGYSAASNVTTGSVAGGGVMDLVRGTGLRVDYTTSTHAVATVHIIATGSGYTTGSGKTTSGGTGTGCVLSITANGSGKVTAITHIDNGGTGYTVGDTLTITSGGGDAQVQVDSVGGSGIITSITGFHGGRNYEVGDQVAVLAGDGAALLEITAVQAPTWYLEFAGGQRFQPSVKYKVTSLGLDIEIESIGIHKLALESIKDLTVFCTNFMPSQSDVGGGEWNAAKYAQGDDCIVDFQYWGTTTRDVLGHIQQSTGGSGLYHWHAPLGAIWKFLDAAMTEAMEYYLMTGYQGSSGTNLSGVYPATNSYVKLNRGANIDFAQPSLGTATGSLHDSSAELTEIRFIFAVTQSAQVTVSGTLWDSYRIAKERVGGLFSEDPNGLKRDAANAWELMKHLHEQFFLKTTPYYEYDGSHIFLKWNITQPYGSAYSSTTIEYTDGQGEETEFESNKDRVGEVKTHNYVQSWDLETWEISGASKGDKNIEMNHIFDIRFRTPKDETSFRFDRIGSFPSILIRPSYANLRGLYSMYEFSGTVGEKVCKLKGLSPRITFTYRQTGSTDNTITDVDIWSEGVPSNLYLYALANDGGARKMLSASKFLDTIRRLQLSESGFQTVAHIYLSMFGSYYDSSAPSWWGDSNNQTGYELSLPLQTIALPHRVGAQVTITPHSALTSYISDKGYLIETEVDWTAKSDASDIVKTKWLTRSISYD